jgi:hypothetical protein
MREFKSGQQLREALEFAYKDASRASRNLAAAKRRRDLYVESSETIPNEARVLRSEMLVTKWEIESGEARVELARIRALAMDTFRGPTPVVTLVDVSALADLMAEEESA